MSTNTEPVSDGDVREYTDPEAAAAKKYFSRHKNMIFINGMGNSPADHKNSALDLSYLQMRTVTGVYNLTQGFFTDLGQCIADKFQFDGPLSSDPGEVLDSVVKKMKQEGKQSSRVQIMEDAISRNKACLSMFRQLRDKKHDNSPVVAHSQGNLILSNALSAIMAVDGANATRGRVVHSYGSPTVNWPKGIRLQEYGFTFDPVNWLSGIDFSISISSSSFLPVCSKRL